MKTLIALCVVAALLMGCAMAEDAPEQIPVLAEFSATDLNLNPMDQTLLEGHKLTMVNVWATYCNPCLSEIPALQKLHADLSEKGFQVVGIITDVQDSSLLPVPSQITLAKEILEQLEAEYPQLVPGLDIYVFFLTQIQAVPFTFFVDEKGNLVGNAYYGARNEEKWLEIITPLLDEVAP